MSRIVALIGLFYLILNNCHSCGGIQLSHKQYDNTLMLETKETNSIKAYFSGNDDKDTSPKHKELDNGGRKTIEDLKSKKYSNLNKNVTLNGNEFLNSEAYKIMRYTLGAVGGAFGLVLLFGGVQIPKYSSAIVFGYGYGLILFTILWFGMSGVETKTRFIVCYSSAALFGLIMIWVSFALAPFNALITGSLGALSYMILGIMLNTVGMYKLVPDNLTDYEKGYYTFSIIAGAFFIFGLILHIVLGEVHIVEKRYLAMVSYSFIGSYLLIKACGIAAWVYPNEWGNLFLDPYVGSWQYYTMFSFTFVLAILMCIFQFFIYKIGPDDQFREGGPMTSDKVRTQSQSSNRRPSHASARLLMANKDGSLLCDNPEFGGAYNISNGINTL